MHVDVCQRWNNRNTSYRPARETIDTSIYEIGDIDHSAAKDFIVKHHYSGSYPAAIARYGLYRNETLVGVCVYSDIMKNVLESIKIDIPMIELSRLVLLDDVEANGETWFMAETRRRLAKLDRADLILTHSDDMPRTSIDGTVTHVGHVGTIYQASNAVYVGRAKRNTLYLLPDGKVFSQRVQSKIRSREQGWQYSVNYLVKHGAKLPEKDEDLTKWLNHWRPLICRKYTHPGNHRYFIPIKSKIRKFLPDSLPYPKIKI
jgi:hypothetical protein